MDYLRLKPHLEPALGNHSDSLWEDFCKLPHPQTAESFLAWLFEEKKIGFGQLEQILTSAPIEIGQMPASQNIGVHHQLLRQLGQGAMGVVHLAKDPALLRKVAYKQLLGEASLPVVRRFLNEVRITAQLQHPAIVPVYQLSLAPGTAEIPQISYSMKLVQGDTLKERLQAIRSQLDQNQKPGQMHNLRAMLEIFLQVCDAMAYAHTRQVIHRDLKPANLMIGPYGDVYVMDWGIARRFQDKELDLQDVGEFKPHPTDSVTLEQDLTQIDQTQAGQILGTPRYMSPQQAAGKNSELDGRSDLFSLGLILYEILTLKTAFTANNQLELLKKVLKAELQPMDVYHRYWPIPAELKAIVFKATQRKLTDRYSQVEEMSHDIRRFLRGETVSVYKEPPLQQSLRFLRRHGKVTLMTTLSLVLGSLLVMGGSLIWQVHAAVENSRREAILSRFLSVASNRAQAIDQHLLALQGRLEHLAAFARQALLQGQPQTGHLYLNEDFVPGSRAPDDFGPAPAYNRPISLSQASIKLAPEVSLSGSIFQLRQLLPLQKQFYGLFMATAEKQDPKSFESELRQKGLPLVWAYVGLESGIHVSFPGKGGYPPSYDPRKRPWYLQAKSHLQPFWGDPYQDASGQGLLLPALAPLRNKAQQLLGVAGLDLNLQRLSQNLLPIPQMPEITRTELLNASGDVWVAFDTQSQQVQSFSPPKKHSVAGLATQLKSSPNGVMTLKDGGQLAWFRLSSLGWYYVVIAPHPF